MNRAEIQALIDAAPDGRCPPQPPGPPILRHQAGRPRVTVPYGQHALDGPLVIPRRIEVDFSGSVLLVANGIPAIKVAKEAFGACVRSVCVFGSSQNGAAHGADGVLVEATYAQLADVLVRFVGIGVRITSLGGGLPDGVQASNVVIFNCDVALAIKGGDTNGGYFAGIGIQSCRVGIVDESFLGNTFAGLLLHTIAERAYQGTVGANYSTLVGTYLEGDCGSALPGKMRDTLDDKPNATWLGGGGSCYAKTGTRVGLNTTRIRCSDTLPGGDTLFVTIPHGAVESALTAERKTPAGTLIDGFRLRWTQLLKACGVEVYATHGGPGLTRPLGWTSVGHAAGFGHARVNAEASPGNPNGVEIPKP